MSAIGNSKIKTRWDVLYLHKAIANWIGPVFGVLLSSFKKVCIYIYG